MRLRRPDLSTALLLLIEALAVLYLTLRIVPALCAG